MLANEIGPRLFLQLCAEFLKAHANESVSWRVFEMFLATRSGKRLDWFYAQWFDSAGLPLLYATWMQAGDGIDVTLHQCGASFRLDQFPLQVRSTDTDGNVQTQMMRGDFQGNISTVHLTAPNDVYRVNPDPDHTFVWLPGVCGR
jgi:aminopeptidase N